MPVKEPDPAGEKGLSPEELERYSRHLIIPEVGPAGQEKLKESSVLLVGAGGLGSPLALYLAAAGVGRLGLVDFDVVEFTNLQRQVIYNTADVGRPKLDSARERIRGVNPFVDVQLHPVRLTSENAIGIFADYDVVVDGTDNFPTRYLVNDACVLSGKPNVYGSIFRFEGQTSVFDAGRGPCYRCLYPEPPPPGLVPSCAEGGVLGILPGVIGTLQANETVKLLLGIGDPLIGRLVLFDALALEFREVRLRKDPACPVCGENPSITGLIDYEEFCGIGAGAPGLLGVPEMTASDLARRRDEVDLIDVREPFETEIAAIPGARLIPLRELSSRMGEIDRGHEIVIHCRSGVRSARAARQLLDAGFPRVWNLKGGILAWSDEVDPSVHKY
jgi:molybdopterin/thiamine biosynthesis adenylyltransferase/rhodanese-related sulfurtransferase